MKKIAPHLKEIIDTLGDVDEETIKNELQRYVHEFDIPISEAKRIILKKYSKSKKTFYSVQSGGDFFHFISRGRKRLLEDLRNGEKNVDLTFRILKVEEKILRDGRKIFTGVIADLSGKLPFTSWVESPEFIPENILHVENAYVKEWHGIPCVYIGKSSRVSRVDDKKMPLASELSKPRKKRISELIEKDGALDVIVEGDILSVKRGSGKIMRCPRCERILYDNSCSIHGEVEGVSDLRIKAILDDGTGALMLILNRACVMKLVGDVSSEIGIRKRCIGLPVRVRGNFSKGTMIAEEIDEVRDDLSEKLARFLGRYA
ncbi:MAG: hypothetical protein ACXQTD_01045 [Candidatus Syntropharchaeia archaeon]